MAGVPPDRLEFEREPNEARDWIVLPVDGGAVTCGNRRDLVKKQRRHHWVYLGLDVDNHGVKGFREVAVFACVLCGKDRRLK
jgi:hypothetical protein